MNFMFCMTPGTFACSHTYTSLLSICCHSVLVGAIPKTSKGRLSFLAGSDGSLSRLLLEFLCVSCFILFVLFQVLPFVTEEVLVRPNCGLDSWDLWHHAISLLLCSLDHSSVPFKKWNENTKQSSPPGSWHVSKVPMSFGGNEFLNPSPRSPQGSQGCGL